MLGRPTRYLACPDCDLLYRPVELHAGACAYCRRCGARIQRSAANMRQRALAFLVASLVLFAVANALPFLSLSVGGIERENRLISAVLELQSQGYWLLAIAVFVACIAAPLAVIAGLLAALAPDRGWRWARVAVERVRAWGMLDVFLLGALVALIKLGDLAEVRLGGGFYAYALLVLATTVAAVSVEPLWAGREPRH